jgi:hypothetical protein
MGSSFLTLEELRATYRRQNLPASQVDWPAIRRLLRELESILQVGETVPITPGGGLCVTRRKRGLVFSRRA